MAGKGPGKRAWGKVAPAKNVSLLSVMSEQLATNLQTQPSKYTAKPHILAELKSMGFSQERIDTAAMKTGNARSDAALEWLLANPERRPLPETKAQPTPSGRTTQASSEDNNKEAGEISQSEADSRLAVEMQDRAIALQLASQEGSELSLEEARQLRRGYSKVKVSKDPKFDTLFSEQQKAWTRGMKQSREETDKYWETVESSKGSKKKPATMQEKMLEMVTKHNEDEAHARNAERLMSLEFADTLAGDMSKIKLSGKTYNSFKRQVQRLKVRSDRKNMGGRMTRASYAKNVSNNAEAAIFEREGEPLDFGPGSLCMALASADSKWHPAVVVGLATSLPRRYKVRFEDTGLEEFVQVADVKETENEAQEPLVEEDAIVKPSSSE